MIRIATFLQIPVLIHWSCVVLVAMFTFMGRSILQETDPGFQEPLYILAGIITGLLILVSVVAHEYGHALTARRYRIGTESITLFGLGGIAALSREASTPKAEGLIAVAGPLASLATGAVFFATSFLFRPLSSLATGILMLVAFSNVIFAVFNMIPAFPLDGGRTLRAALWARCGDRNRAMLHAANVGQTIAMFGGLYAALIFDLWTAAIATFIFFQAKAAKADALYELRGGDMAWRMKQI